MQRVGPSDKTVFYLTPNPQFLGVVEALYMSLLNHLGLSGETSTTLQLINEM